MAGKKSLSDLGALTGQEPETPAVAEVGIIGAELVPVIAQCQRGFETAGQGLEAAEMGEPLVIGETAEPDPLGPAPVPMAQHGLGKISGSNGIEKGVAEGGMGFGGNELGHGLETLADATRFVAFATRPCTAPSSERHQIGL